MKVKYTAILLALLSLYGLWYGFSGTELPVIKRTGVTGMPPQIPYGSDYQDYAAAVEMKLKLVLTSSCGLVIASVMGAYDGLCKKISRSVV